MGRPTRQQCSLRLADEYIESAMYHMAALLDLVDEEHRIAREQFDKAREARIGRQYAQAARLAQQLSLAETELHRGMRGED